MGCNKVVIVDTPNSANESIQLRPDFIGAKMNTLIGAHDLVTFYHFILYCIVNGVRVKKILLLATSISVLILVGCAGHKPVSANGEATRSAFTQTGQSRSVTPLAIPTLNTSVIAKSPQRAPELTAKPATSQTVVQKIPASTVKCPKGFVSAGKIIRIDTAKNGSVTEVILRNNGIEMHLPPFKPTKLYKSKEGDPYCEDTTPDND